MSQFIIETEHEHIGIVHFTSKKWLILEIINISNPAGNYSKYYMSVREKVV